MKTLIHWFRLLFSPKNHHSLLCFEPGNYFVQYPDGQRSQGFSYETACEYRNIFGGDVIKIVKKGRIK